MTTDTDLRPRYRSLLADDVEANIPRFEPESGRFLTGTGWAVTNQDIIYPLALLSLKPGTRWHGDEQIFNMVIRGGDALRDFQYEDGTVEFVKTDGSKWGAIYMPWSMYHWLETFLLVREHLDRSRHTRWLEGLTLAYDGISSALDNEAVHNIPVWNGAACYRAGTALGVESWRAAGLRMIERAIEGQHPAGYWPEHGGPTPSYNLVYVHALGLYHAFSGDESVLPALARATEFQIRYTYPDGRLIETVDGRVKYHDRIPLVGHVGLQHTAKGRRYLEFLLDHLYEDRNHADARSESDATDRERDVISSGSVRTAEKQFGLVPHLASAWEHVIPGPTEPIPQDSRSYHIVDEEIGVLRRSGRWASCVSLMTTRSVSSRWGQDRQQFLSLWLEGYGLLVGGGNSKDQPEWSSFEVPGQGETAWIPEAAKQTGTDSCRYTIGDASVDLSVIHVDERELELRWNAPEGTRLRLIIRVGRGSSVDSGERSAVVLGDAPVAFSGNGSGESLLCNGVRYTVDAPWEFTWPKSPFNPYTKDGSSPASDIAGILTIYVKNDLTTTRIFAQY